MPFCQTPIASGRQGQIIKAPRQAHTALLKKHGCRPWLTQKGIPASIQLMQMVVSGVAGVYESSDATEYESSDANESSLI